MLSSRYPKDTELTHAEMCSKTSDAMGDISPAWFTLSENEDTAILITPSMKGLSIDWNLFNSDVSTFQQIEKKIKKDTINKTKNSRHRQY